MTPHESKLWYQFLRSYPVRFLRQKPIDGYIVDFYCSKAKLVIELDGSGHFTDEAKTYDAERTQRLKDYGLYIVRIMNRDVDANFNIVCQYIDKEVTKRIHGSLSPLNKGAVTE